MTRNIPLGTGAEFDLIRALVERWGPLASGIGDDAAMVKPPRGEQLVVSTDTALEDVHFRRAWLSSREIAHRAVTAALSDLAAMAAKPLGVLIALQWPASLDHDQLLAVADGIADAVRATGPDARIVGGNLARASQLGFTTTVVGSVYEPLLRSSARPGDLLYVTGELGGPAAALRLLQAGADVPSALRERFAAPRARISEARWLATRGAVAAIDISDGLSSDAAHLAAASRVGLDIGADRIPVMFGTEERDAIAGGEEYELLVAARAPLPVDQFRDAFAVPLTAIGRVVEGDGTVIFHRAGKRVATPAGYDHFSR